MYNIRQNLRLGFHGCDESTRNELINNPDHVKKSEKDYDWLGHGFYLWENNLTRAFKWAESKFERNEIKNPSVVGVVYSLGYCFDLTDSIFIDSLPVYFKMMKQEFEELGKEIPTNKDLSNDENKDKILRNLDCSVLEYMHERLEEQIKEDIKNKGFSKIKKFDSVRGVFTEGGPIYEGAGIQSKTHIQICIRNLNCIKGFFKPRNETSF